MSGAGFTSEDMARADLARAQYARALKKMRDTLTAVHDELEDEGDRVYLGSSNHAELIREAWHLADALNWDEILADTQPRTPLADVNLALQAELATTRTLREALQSLATAVATTAMPEAACERLLPFAMKAQAALRASLAEQEQGQ